MKSTTGRSAIGLDFGTESVRAVVVSLTGRELGSAVVRYRRGQILDRLPGSSHRLPPNFALQDPRDWIDSAAAAVRIAMKAAQRAPESIVGIGVDFTSCTMLPTKIDGTPLCEIPTLRGNPYAWPKLWKHHGAIAQTNRMNAVARQRKEPWLARYGGVIGLEWFFPKILETLAHAPRVYDAADVWLEGGDWFVWQLVGGDAKQLPRSTCQAGYKALWNAQTGYPPRAYLKAVHPDLADVVTDKMPGVLIPPGQRAGVLCETMARKLGLAAGTPVSAAIIDAHAGVPGAGVSEPGTLVMVLGTSSCHMLNATRETLVPGVAGVVKDGILPGFFGYETGQAAVGDAFAWYRELVGHRDFKRLDDAARKLPPGSEGVLCMDWFNGCRTPLMDGSLKGAITGLTLAHRAEHGYRAVLEASAFGLRWIVDLLRGGGVPVKKFVATGGLPHHNPLLVRIYADVLGEDIEVHPSTQGPALGAAILGALAAGSARTGFESTADAIEQMAGRARRQSRLVRPAMRNVKAYAPVYRKYRELAAEIAAT